MTPITSMPARVESLEQLNAEEQAELAELLDRYLQRWEVGDASSMDELLRQRPEWEHVLRDYAKQLDELQLALAPSDRINLHSPYSRESHSREPHFDGLQGRLGDYHLIEEIGRGGMGIVYRARQLSLGRDVAIKTLPFASVLDQKQIKRFQNEAQAAGQLHHPNIVPVYAVGCERGVHYYSMQLIEGLSLEQVINDLRSAGLDDVKHQTTIIQSVDAEISYQERVKKTAVGETKVGERTSTFASVRNRSHIESVLRLGVQAAEALHYAHQCGVIHRDIKPSNLMIDSRANLWITDFGLARCQQSTPMSVTGDLMGTLRYMSPEQASGRVHAVDHRTDVYALGVTLYEMLTLEYAFDAPHRIELITLINESNPIAPRRLNPAIPSDLETVILKAMSRQPMERYESAGDFEEDLKRVMRGERPLAKRPTVLNRAVQWVGRHQHLFGVLAATLVLLVVGLSIATMIVSKHKHAAVSANERAELHLIQANHVVHNFGDLVVERLADMGEGEIVREELLGELRNYYSDFIEYATNDADMTKHVVEARLRLAEVHIKTNRWAEAAANLNAAMESIAKQATQSLPPTVADALLSQSLAKLAVVQATDESLGPWQVSMRRAIELGLNGSPSAKSTFVIAGLYAQEGELWLMKDQSREAVAALHMASACLDDAREQDEGLLDAPEMLKLDLIVHNNLASLAQHDDPQKSAGWLRRAIEAGEKLVSAFPGSPRHRAQLAQLLANQGELAHERKSSSLAEHSLQSSARVWEGLSQQFTSNERYRLELATVQNRLGQFYLQHGRLPLAKSAFLDAAQELASVDLSHHEPATILSDLASIQNNLGLCYERMSQFDDASLCYSRSVDVQRQAMAYDPDNPDLQMRLALHKQNLSRLRSVGTQLESELTQ